LQQEIQHTLNEREERATPETNTNQQHTLENEEKEEIISHKPKPKQKTQPQNVDEKNLKTIYDVDGNEKIVKMCNLKLSTKSNNGRLLQVKDKEGVMIKNYYFKFSRKRNTTI